ncbi:MAG: peptidylprolyl isomerase [Woeseiaceae bacterium]|nr:peptidylprolyl isomerase [Woeseiaceae bacterium]
MKKILQEPLLHFLLIGLGLFVLFEFVGGDADEYDSRVIEVDRDRLLTFVQFRTRAFEPSAAAERLDAMSPEELELLIDDYVREEALHREALALGMDKNDYVIKRRMVQSIEFVTNGFVTAAVEVSDADVATYYAANRDDYFVPPYVTFAHVFLSTEDRDRGEMAAAATKMLAELNAAQAPFSHAPRYGDRFPYFVNYVERSPELVASHFGERMAETVFSLQPSETTWQGPFESAYGAHLVMLVRKADGRYPELGEIADSVRRDAEREAVNSLQDEAIQAIVDTYEVRRSL